MRLTGGLGMSGAVTDRSMWLYRDRAVVPCASTARRGRSHRHPCSPATTDWFRAVAKCAAPAAKFGSRLVVRPHRRPAAPGRNLDIVTQVVSIDAFATDIVCDYGRYTCACAVLEAAERLAGEERAPSWR